MFSVSIEERPNESRRSCIDSTTSSSFDQLAPFFLPASETSGERTRPTTSSASESWGVDPSKPRSHRSNAEVRHMFF
jgi:hypothetical protein